MTFVEVIGLRLAGLALLSVLACSAVEVKPFFETHCIACHGPEKSKGKITLHTLSESDLADGRELERWETILDVLAAGEMPPEDEPQPPETERQAMATWIETGLRDYVAKASQEAAATTARRLTNFEYQNTMRDLLGVDLEYAKRLPEDPEKPYHFNNTAEFMLLGPDQYDRYLEIARQALKSVIVDPEKPEVKRLAKTLRREERVVQGRAGDEVGVYGELGLGSINTDDWPATGEYRVRIEVAAILPEGHEEVPMRVLMGSHLRHDSGTGDYYPVGTAYVRNRADESQILEFRGRMENHPLQVGAVTAKGPGPSKRYLYVQNVYDNGHLNGHRRGGFDGSYRLDLPRLIVRSWELEAPVVDVWPPEHHTRILFPSALREKDPPAYVRAVLERFLSRAFRRPPTTAELDRFCKLNALLAPQFDSFEAAMRETLAMVLMSPQFLYHNTVEPAYALASRLSYFLWGSMPDEALFAKSADGSLAQPEVMAAEVQRMLADAKSRDFAQNFSRQWLSIDKMHAIKVNQALFPHFLYTVHLGERRGQEILFRPTVRDYLEQETVGFVAELIARNANLLELVDADFAMLNERLAAHYGVPGVKGMKIRPVPLADDSKLGGLLTQGSVLLANSTGSAPHTIYRAVWLREAIFGDTVKPPPAEVPALVDTAGDDAENAVTIKDLLRLHRQKESCNDCHVRLDPWGIPFERFNAIGQFQPKVPARGVRIPHFNEGTHGDWQQYLEVLKTSNTVTLEAAAKVPHGPEVDGIPELKRYVLRHRKDDIVQNVVQRLLTYAIGRELTYRDRFEVERLVAETKATGYGLRDAIVAICQSPSFMEEAKRETQ